MITVFKQKSGRKQALQLFLIRNIAGDVILHQITFPYRVVNLQYALLISLC